VSATMVGNGQDGGHGKERGRDPDPDGSHDQDESESPGERMMGSRR
jgi:hypothetical protein